MFIQKKIDHRKIKLIYIFDSDLVWRINGIRDTKSESDLFLYARNL